MSAKKGQEKKEEKKGGCFVVSALGALIIILFFNLFRPQTIPFSFFHFWKINGSLIESVLNSWPIFVWGVTVSILISGLTRNDPRYNSDAEEHLLTGVGISIWAGVAEEICFRWLIFYGAIITIKIINWIFFGWAGFGILELMYTSILIPVADFATLGYLKPILLNGYEWAVGAAIISANGKFRNGHAYQGLFGYVNSWFCGMFLFYVMFKYGLPSAIIVHFLYDLLIFTVHYLDAVIERKLR